MNEKAKAGRSQVEAAIALNFGDESRLLSKESLTQMEEAVETFCPDVLNPYGRYRQTGRSAYINPEAGETVDKPNPETRELARSHLVTTAYAHEPIQEIMHVLVQHYGEYATALYAAGAASTILQAEGMSTVSLSRAFVAETILALALGDPILAEEAVFTVSHVRRWNFGSNDVDFPDDGYTFELQPRNDGHNVMVDATFRIGNTISASMAIGNTTCDGSCPVTEATCCCRKIGI